MDNSIIGISKSLIQNIENIDELVDSHFDQIKDVTETVVDIFIPIKAIHSLYTLNKKRRFKNFLKSYATCLKDNQFETFESLETLKDYLKNEKNFDFLNGIIENAINAKSKYGAILLGYYAGITLLNKQDIRYKDLILIDGIKELNDIEIACFTKIFNITDRSKMVYFHPLEKQLESNDNSYELTIEKLIRLFIIEKDHHTYHDSNKNSNFTSTEIAEQLFQIINKSGIFNELLNYQI